ARARPPEATGLLRARTWAARRPRQSGGAPSPEQPSPPDPVPFGVLSRAAVAAANPRPCRGSNQGWESVHRADRAPRPKPALARGPGRAVPRDRFLEEAWHSCTDA